MPLTVQGRPSGVQWAWLVGLGVVVLGGALLGAVALLRWSETYEPGARQMSDRMMDKKSRQLQRVLDGMLAHDYERVADAVHEIEEISESMKWFVEDAAYEGDRAAFRESLRALDDAVDQNNTDAAIRSADALVESCMRCHEHLVQDGRSPL